MAICRAKHHRIPILNLAETDMRAAMDGLYRMAQIRDRRDLEQDLAISGGSADASPSVAPARSRHDKRMRTGGWRQQRISMSVPESLRRRPSSTPCISDATVRAAGKPEPSRGYNGMLNASCFCFRPLNGVTVWAGGPGAGDLAGIAGQHCASLRAAVRAGGQGGARAPERGGSAPWRGRGGSRRGLRPRSGTVTRCAVFGIHGS